MYYIFFFVTKNKWCLSLLTNSRNRTYLEIDSLESRFIITFIFLSIILKLWILVVITKLVMTEVFKILSIEFDNLFEGWLYYLSYNFCQFSRIVFLHHFTFRCVLIHIITLIMAIVCVHFLHTNYQHSDTQREHFIDTFISV